MHEHAPQATASEKTATILVNPNILSIKERMCNREWCIKQKEVQKTLEKNQKFWLWEACPKKKKWRNKGKEWRKERFSNNDVDLWSSSSLIVDATNSDLKLATYSHAPQVPGQARKRSRPTSNHIHHRNILCAFPPNSWTSALYWHTGTLDII